jgi:predicted AlkP superfamily phosphohydrolase/phosphomutase
MSRVTHGGPQLAVVQFDAVNLPLVERLIDDGRLPTLAGLRAAGEWTPLSGPARHLEGSSATTLHSGLPPGEHGVYHPFGWSPERQGLRLRRPENVPETIWTRLGRAGRRTLLIDPYDSVRERSVAGVAVCGWQLTNRVVLPRWSSPSRAERKLARRLGRAAHADETFGATRVRDLLRLRRVLLDAPARAARAARELLKAEPFDLVWIELVASHVAGHQFWNPSAAVDLTGAAADDRAALEGALADVYEASDRALGDILAALPDDADVIVMSATGMASETDRSDLLPGMLDAILHGRPGGRGGGALWSVRAALPASVRAQVARTIPDRAALELTARLSGAGTDWRRTRAVAVPNEPCGAVRLNVRGREREGIVEPADVDELVHEIKRGLLTFREPDGGAVVTGVDRIEVIEPGARSHLLPDLSVRWSEDPSSGLERVESPELGEVRRLGRGSGRSGNHAGDGWAILAPRRSRVRATGRPPKLLDIPATVSAVLGDDAALHALPGEPLLEAPGG